MCGFSTQVPHFMKNLYYIHTYIYIYVHVYIYICICMTAFLDIMINQAATSARTSTSCCRIPRSPHRQPSARKCPDVTRLQVSAALQKYGDQPRPQAFGVSARTRQHVQGRCPGWPARSRVLSESTGRSLLGHMQCQELADLTKAEALGQEVKDVVVVSVGVGVGPNLWPCDRSSCQYF